MGNTKPQFPSTDAWVLTSIYLASLGGDSTLARIIGTGDFISHAIFTLHELNGGLRRLHEAGHIEVEDGVYTLTEKGKEITEIDKNAKKGPFHHMETIRKRLRAGDWGARILPRPHIHDEDAYVTEEMFRVAYAEYTESLKRPKPSAMKQSQSST
jgi:hypothetical protein